MKKRTIAALVGAALVAGMAIATLVPAVAATRPVSSAVTPTVAPPAPQGGGPGGPGHGPGGPLGGGLVEVVAKLTGESTATVQSAMRSGTSLAAIAKAKSVSVGDIVALALHAPTAYLDSEVTDGLVTKSMEASQLAAIKQQLTDMVNGVPGSAPACRPGPAGPGGPGMPPPSRSTTSGPPAPPSGTPTTPPTQ